MSEAARRIDREILAIYAIITSGAFLLITTAVLCWLVWNATNEIIKNREVGCVSRYLDGQDYAPACAEFVSKYKEQHGE